MQLFGTSAAEVLGHLPAWADTSRVLAHQGGWDEILMVLVPVSVFAALLYVANQRATRLAERNGDGNGDGNGDVDTGLLAGTPKPASERPEAPERNERGGPI